MKARGQYCLTILAVITVWTLGRSGLAQEPIAPTEEKPAAAPDAEEQPSTPAALPPPSEQSAPAAAAEQSEPPAPEKSAPPTAQKPSTSPKEPKKIATPQPKKATAPTTKPADKKAWRRDKSIPRRPGSYLGGGIGYSMVNSWYTVKQKDLKVDYDIGPVHGYMSFIRVGDAFFEWLAVGFQVDLIGATLAGTDKPGASAFGLYVDTTFYPWRGLGLRPCIGVGFGYAQAGKETYELGFGGPLTLSFAASYEFRVSRGFTMGPMIQVSWVKGEDFDAVFFNVGLEFLKWFKTATR
jgi:hypothetical protein